MYGGPEVQIKSTYFIHDEALQHEDSVRDLVVTLDSELTFQAHINDILEPVAL